MERIKNLMVFAFILTAWSAQAQKPDSVKIGGTYYYVYPYVQPATPSSPLLKAMNSKERAMTRENQDQGLISIDLDYFEQEYYMEELKLSKAQKKMLRKNAERNYVIYSGESQELIPALDVLPDGKYIQYFQKYWRFNEKDEIVAEEKKIAGYFSLKNNLPDGKALWVNMVGDTVKYGNFRQGLKEGEWLSKLFSIDDSYIFIGLKSGINTEPDAVMKENYADGVLNGQSRTWVEGNLSSKGQYTDGKPSGEWFHYTSTSLKRNGSWIDTVVLTRHYTLADQSLVSHKPYIRTSFNHGYLPHKYFSFPDYLEPMLFNEFWRLNRDEEDALELPEENITSYEGEEYDYEMEEYYEGDYGNDDGFTWINNKYLPTGKLIDSIGLINEYQGVYEEFWDNGELKIRLNYVNGELVKEDTIFWDNGKAADVIVYDPVTKQYENRRMDFTGVLYEVNVYDSLGKFIKQTLDPFYKDKHILIDGLYAELVEDYLYLGFEEDQSIEWVTFMYDRMDTLKTPDLTGNIVLSKNWYGDSSLWKSSVYNADARTLTEEVRSLNGILVSQSVMEYDEQFDNVMGTTVARLQDLELKQTFNGSFNSIFRSFAQDSFPAMRMQSPNLFELTDDKMLRYKNEPFTGKLNVNLNAKSFGISIGKNEIKINLTTDPKFLEKLYKDYKKYTATGKSKYADALSVSTQIDEEYASVLLTLFPELSFLIVANNQNYQPDALMMGNHKITGSYLNGKPNGSWKSLDEKGKPIVECAYLNGELDGTIKMYSYAFPRNSKKKKTKQDEFEFDYSPEPFIYDTLPPKPVYFVSSKINIKNGQLHGDLISYNWQGKIRSKVNYVNGFPEGPASEHNSIASTYMNFEDGQLDGIIRTYLHLPGRDSILLYELNYQNGALQGESRSYHTNGKLSKRGFFVNGMPIDDYEGYDSLGTRFHYVKFQYSFPVEEKIWEANQLSVRYLFDWKDSIYFKPTDITQATSVDNLIYQYGLDDEMYTQPYFGRPSLVEKTGINYHMTKYFPNDSISRDGDLKAGKKAGNWKFFNYEGEKLYEVNYFDTILKINDIQFKSKGMLYDYDAKGNLISRSYIIEKFEKYDCSHTDHYEVRQFYTVWQAHDSLHRINGYVKNHYDNGVLQSEGNMKDGLPTGVWKYYDPFGKLNHVGEYKNGKRDGRWLSGDLSKSKYLGDICMNPNLPNLEEQMKYQEKMLDIYIRYFKMGKLLNSEYYDLNLNDYEDQMAAPEEEEER